MKFLFLLLFLIGCNSQKQLEYYSQWQETNSHCVIVYNSPCVSGWGTKPDQTVIFIVEYNERIYINGIWGKVGDTLVVKNSWISKYSWDGSWGIKL